MATAVTYLPEVKTEVNPWFQDKTRASRCIFFTWEGGGGGILKYKTLLAWQCFIEILYTITNYFSLWQLVLKSILQRLNWTEVKPYCSPSCMCFNFLKGHGNKADFPRFLHKSVWHWPLTLHFQPFWFWLQIRGDICNRKTTRRQSGVVSSPSCYGESGSSYSNFFKFIINLLNFKQLIQPFKGQI